MILMKTKDLSKIKKYVAEKTGIKNLYIFGENGNYYFASTSSCAKLDRNTKEYIFPDAKKITTDFDLSFDNNGFMLLTTKNQDIADEREKEKFYSAIMKLDKNRGFPPLAIRVADNVLFILRHRSICVSIPFSLWMCSTNTVSDSYYSTLKTESQSMLTSKADFSHVVDVKDLRRMKKEKEKILYINGVPFFTESLLSCASLFKLEKLSVDIITTCSKNKGLRVVAGNVAFIIAQINPAKYREAA